MYKLIDSQITRYDNPLITSYGIITNPTKEILVHEGYKELVQNIPSYNSETQYIEFSNYAEDENNIYQNYIVKDIVIDKETIEEKINRLEQELQELKNSIQ